MTLEQLEKLYVWINWREPAEVSLFHESVKHYACRVCIANKGLQGFQIPGLPTDRSVVLDHIRKEHTHETDHDQAS